MAHPIFRVVTISLRWSPTGKPLIPYLIPYLIRGVRHPAHRICDLISGREGKMTSVLFENGILIMLVSCIFFWDCERDG